MICVTWKHIMASKLRFKVPTWRFINSPKCVKNKLNRKVNNEMYKTLTTAGWDHWDSCNILYEGYTITCRKTFPKLQHGYLHFSWCWDNHGGNDFWMGTLYGFYNYKPEEGCMHPRATFEIRDITNDTFEMLPTMEQRLIKALNSQTKL